MDTKRLPDVLVGVGLLLITVGSYLAGGWPAALLVPGGILLLLGLVGAWRQG